MWQRLRRPPDAQIDAPAPAAAPDAATTRDRVLNRDRDQYETVAASPEDEQRIRSAAAKAGLRCRVVHRAWGGGEPGPGRDACTAVEVRGLYAHAVMTLWRDAFVEIERAVLTAPDYHEAMLVADRVERGIVIEALLSGLRRDRAGRDFARAAASARMGCRSIRVSGTE